MSLVSVHMPSSMLGEGGGGPGGPDDPTISLLTPNTVSAAAGPTTITITGTKFEAGSVVEINQVAQATTFVSETSLTVSYDPTVAGTVLFSVRNPSEEESNSVPFTVAALAADDVSSWTIDDVKAFVVANPELLSEVHAFEGQGKARAGLLEWLQQLLDEEAASNPESMSLSGNGPSPTEAVPGAPGEFLPSGSAVPENISALRELELEMETLDPWGEGEYIAIGTGNVHWDGTDWAKGIA